MNLRSVEIPDEPAALAGWLQGELAGWRLADLTAELAAVHGATAEPTPALADVIGEHADAVLASGLGALPAPALQTLLRHPVLLLELQRWLLEESTPFWVEWFQAGPAREPMLRHTRERLQEWLEQAQRSRATQATIPSRRPALRWLAVPFAMAAAVAVLVGGYVYMQHANQAGEWGWNRPEVFANAPAATYLDRLAEAAQQWFDERPETAEGVAERIASMRLGCTRLILAEHASLAPADRAWLRERCRAWSAKFDEQLREIEAGKDPIAVRGQADATVHKLVNALRDRAQKVQPPAQARLGRWPAPGCEDVVRAAGSAILQ